MALGAFLAGVLLAESEYRRELETDIEPFKGLLLGLFFIAVGMSIDFAVVLAQPLLIAGVVVGFLLIKAARALGDGAAMPMPAARAAGLHHPARAGRRVRLRRVPAAAQAGVITAPVSSLLIAAVALSMLLTPLLLVAADRWWIPLLRRPQARDDRRDQASRRRAGHHRRLRPLRADRRPPALSPTASRPTVLDHDAEQIEALRSFGWRVFYGDATRLDLLRTAGAASARVLVLAIDDVDQQRRGREDGARALSRS